MVPREWIQPIRNVFRLMQNAHAHRDVFQARLPWEEMVKLNKLQRQHFYHHGDTICHPKSGTSTSQLFSSFLSSTYAGHINLAAAKHWHFMPNWKDGSTVEFIIFRV